jgi:hypothetical protein
LRRIAVKLSVPEVMMRIGLSAFPTGLLAYLPNIYGDKVRDLKPVARSLFSQTRSPADAEVRKCFDPESITSFADLYWSLAREERCVAGDFTGAWNIVKLACLGERAFDDQVDWVFRPLSSNEPVGLLVSVDCGRRMVQDMHALLAEKKLVPDTLKELMPESVDWEKDWPAGINVAEAIGGFDPNGQPPFKAIGLQALAIARFVSTHTIQLDDIDEVQPTIMECC